MPKNEEAPDIGALHLSDSDPEDLVASPSKQGRKSKPSKKQSSLTANPSIDPSKPRNPESRHSVDEAREASLRKELESVRSINTVIEGVIDSLERAKANMDTVSRTVQTSTTLLQTWTRILAQTEHNQRLILNPAWQGASHDIADMENEVVMRQHAAEKREIEEQHRRETAARRAEEEERRRTEPVAVGKGVTRGRGRGGPRRAASRSGVVAGRGAGAGYVGVGGQGGRGTARGSFSLTGRAASGIGRGLSAANRRGRGVG